MPEMDDITLLREYAETGSEAAFAALVERHVNLVYSTALRSVGNPHAAEEITQAVFIILARKAQGLSQRTVLSGWLYQTTRLTAANFLRTEIRRQHREQEAYMQSLLNETEDNAWMQIAPLLDTAMARLGEKDHNALVLRFFESRNFKDVSAALGTSEDGAKMRVNRALEKLRKFFTKRGVTLSAVAIAGAVSANSIQAAPVGLAKTITAVALAKGTAAGGSTLTLIKGALKIMAWTKVKTAVVAGVGVLLAAVTTTTLVIQHRHHIVPRSSWTFAGYANPESAFQSSIWAISKGDTQTWLASLTPAMQMEVRQKAAGNDAKIIGDDDKRDFARITGYRILDRQVLSKDEVVFEVYAEGLNQTTKASIQRIGSEWKFGGKAKR